MRFDQLPDSWQQEVRKLRAECARYRSERNTFKAALKVAMKTNGESKDNA